MAKSAGSEYPELRDVDIEIKYTNEVSEFIRAIQKAHEDAANSTVVFK